MSQELATKREVVLVGDFQQLQPIHGVHQLRVDLDREAAARQLRRGLRLHARFGVILEGQQRGFLSPLVAQSC